MTIEENNTYFEVLTEKPVELKKDEFFKLLAKQDLDLTILRVGKTYISKWKNEKANDFPSGCFIDYGFNIDNVEYEVGISYNLGVPIDEETFILSSGMNIFKILNIATDLSKAKEIKVSKKFIEESLTGIRFKATLDSGFNGFVIRPLGRIE